MSDARVNAHVHGGPFDGELDRSGPGAGPPSAPQAGVGAYGQRMTTTDENRPEDVQRRVQDWAEGAIGAVETADGVAVEVEASRTVSLPDAELDVQPEEWLARVTLRFSEADDATAADVFAALAGAGSTVTLASGEAAEIAWPDDADAAVSERPGGAPEGKPVARVVTVGVTIPWPNRTDAQAESA